MDGWMDGGMDGVMIHILLNTTNFDSPRLLFSFHPSPPLPHLPRCSQVQELDGVSLKQANTIASELCTNIQFTSQLLLDQEGIESADTTLDHVKLGTESTPFVFAAVELRSYS
jgi:hypothetical protein